MDITLLWQNYKTVYPRVARCIEENVSLMLDESLDIAIQKKLVLFFKKLVEGKSKVELAANAKVKGGNTETINAGVLKYFKESNVPVKKHSGLGTEGASVMTGHHNGLAMQLQRVYGKIVDVCGV